MTGRSVRRGPADGLRPASWSGTGPWPARVAGTGALRRNGDLFANSVRTCGRRGAGALRPGVSTYSLPCRSPPRGPCSFPRRFREARWDRRPRAGILLCRPARRRAAAPGDCASRPRRTEAIQPPPPHRRKVSPGSVQDARHPGPGRPSTWRAAARRSSLGTDRRWSPSDAAQGPGVEPDATGGGHQVPPRRSAPAATGSAFTLVERPAQLLAAPRPSGPVS